jgi:hypothetical protein
VESIERDINQYINQNKNQDQLKRYQELIDQLESLKNYNFEEYIQKINELFKDINSVENVCSLKIFQ